MTAATPTVTAVIPTYNRRAFLGEALRSVFGQTRPPDEIIVVDDGSTDDTAEFVAQLGPRVTYVRQSNQGPSAARNHGMRRAQGDFIAFLDSDDLWAPDRIERQLEALARHGPLDFVFGLEQKFAAAERFDRIEIVEPDVWAVLSSLDCVLPDPLGLLLREDFIPTSSVLFRRAQAEAVGPIDESLRQAEDYDFWLRFAARGCRFGFVNQALCLRRLHPGNLVNDWVGRRVALLTVLERFRDASPADRPRVERRIDELHYDMGSHLLARRRFREARVHLRAAKAGGLRRVKLTVKRSIAAAFS